MRQARGPRQPYVPLEPRPARMTRHQRQSHSTSGAQVLGVLLAISAALLITAHGLALATTPAAAGRTLGAVLPALTDLDQAMAAHAGEVASTAAVHDQDIPVPGLPLRVTVTREAAAAGGAELRRAALDSMVSTVYNRGHAAFRAPDAPAGGAPALFSSQWALWHALDSLKASSHHRLVLARAALAVVTLLLAVGLVLVVDGRRRGVAAGSAIAVGAGLAALGAVLGRLAAWVLVPNNGDIAAAAVSRIAHDLSMTVVATALIAGVAALALAALSAAVTTLSRPAPHPASRPVTRRPPAIREPEEES